MSNKARGELYVIAAPSGAGKTSLVAALLGNDPQLKLSISHTTRAARPGEEDGVHYHFIDEQAFQALVDEDAFLEHATVFDYHYGTSKAVVESNLQAGYDVILEIDWQGAEQVRTRFPNCKTIFIIPPSVGTLRDRLSRRGQDSSEVIARRMRDARSEISHWQEFDFLVVNDDFDHALADLQSIFRSQRLDIHRQGSNHAKLLAELVENE